MRVTCGTISAQTRILLTGKVLEASFAGPLHQLFLPNKLSHQSTVVLEGKLIKGS